MAAVFTFTLQGTSPTTIDATDKIQFAAASGFGSAVVVGEFNGSTHVESSVGADDSSGNGPYNSKYIASGTVDIGGGTVALDHGSVTTAACPLKINFSYDSSVTTSAAIFYAYDGSTTTNGPTNVTFYAAERGDTTWTAAEGSAAALGLTDQSTSTTHDFFILLSASPDTVGIKTAFAVRIELTYA